MIWSSQVLVVCKVLSKTSRLVALIGASWHGKPYPSERALRRRVPARAPAFFVVLRRNSVLKTVGTRTDRNRDAASRWTIRDLPRGSDPAIGRIRSEERRVGKDC